MKKLKIRVVRETVKAALLDVNGSKLIVGKGSVLYRIAKNGSETKAKPKPLVPQHTDQPD